MAVASLSTAPDTLGLDSLSLAYHELRSPLGLIVTAATFAAEDCSESSTRQQLLAIARTATRVLEAASRALGLETSVSNDRNEFDLTDALEGPLDAVAGMGVRLLIGPGSPPPVLGDADAAAALVESLLWNAVEHGDAMFPIEVRFIGSATSYALTIKNRRATVPRHRGVGLGRYVSQQLAEAAGARLICDGDPDWHCARVEFCVSPAF